MEIIFVSIIIPTYKDWHRLSLCLDALKAQSFPQNQFEIIVANNDHDDPIPDGFERPVNCKIITEAKPGSYSARNAALKLAKGEIVGFTDSDCIPDRDWITNVVDYFKVNKSVSRVAGNVSIFFKATTPTRAELYDKLYAFNQKEYVNTSGTGVTANLFTYKFLFDKVGYFRDDLMSGGDFSWGVIAQEHGYSIHYVENVIVHHPGRQTLEELIKKEKRVGGAQAFFLNQKGGKAANFFYFLRELLPRPATIKFVYRNGTGLSFFDKLYLYAFRQYLLSVRAFERFRVQNGKKANRS
ncbi:MAG: glycosyltransferase family A protein [Ginsengibacter sp.]